jgi:hypothetical protein
MATFAQQRAQDDGTGPLKRLTPALSDLAELQLSLAGAGTAEEAMDIATRGVRALLGADGSTFVLRDGSRCHYADEDAISPLWKGRRFPMDACISGWCMQHGEAAAIEDIYQDPRIPVDVYRPTFVRSLAMAPSGVDAPVAAMGAYWSERRVITPEELNALQRVAEAATRAMAGLPAQDPSSKPTLGEASSDQGWSGKEQSLWGPGFLRLRPNSIAAFAFAVGCVGIATLARLGIGAFGSGPIAPFSTYYPAILVALLKGGVRAGVLAAVLGGAFACLAFLPPYLQLASPEPAPALNLALYAASAALVIWTTERHRRAIRRLAEEDAKHFALAREVEHRGRNTLSVVQAIVRQSLDHDRDAAAVINGRIKASLTGAVLDA